MTDGNLPDGWRLIRLGDVCATTSGGTPSRAISSYYGGNIRWVKSGELNDNIICETEETITEEAVANSNTKIFPAGTLLIALYGATVGKLGILGVDAATNQAVCAIFVSEVINRDYLFFYLLQQRPELVESSFGGAQPNISQNVVRALEIPLPPLPEQQRIAAIVAEQMATVEQARAAAQDQIELCNDLIHAYLRQSLSAATERKRLGQCLVEVKNGIGEEWKYYDFIGVTREGVAPKIDKIAGLSP